MSNPNTLLSSIVEETRDEGGLQVRSFSLTGEPHAAAIVDAVVYDYSQVTSRPRPTLEDLRALTGAKVTLLRAGESAFGAGSIQAAEGTIFATRDDGVAYLPKGKRTQGYRLSPEGVLDVEVGYNKVGVLKERVDAVRATFPQVEELTKEHLLALPSRSKQVNLVVFGTWPGPDVRSPGAIWCVTEYDREDDIVEGYLIVRPEHGTSEHGSIYGQRLLRVGGRVVNPPALSFAECFDLGNLPYHQALARFVAKEPEATTCRHCGRRIVSADGGWIDPEATGDDTVWRETCDSNDTVTAEHEPGTTRTSAATTPSA